MNWKRKDFGKNKFKHLNRKLLILFILNIFFFFKYNHSSNLYKTNKILILNSYHHGFKWSDDIVKGIKRTIEKKITNNEYFIEYMDTKRQKVTTNYFSSLFELYRKKYNKTKFKLIICTDNEALNFLNIYYKKLFNNIPVVFCGINNYSSSLTNNVKKITGVSEKKSVSETLELAFKLHLDTENVYVICDDTVTGKIDKILIKKEIKKFPWVTFHFISGADYSFSEMLFKLTNIRPYSIIYYSGFYKDRFDLPYSVKETIPVITNLSKAPVYTHSDFIVEYGALGGIVTSALMQGKYAGEMALKILNGKHALSIPVLNTSPNITLFNFKQLKRFNIRKNIIPEDSLIINEPKTFYFKNKSLIWATGIIFTILVVLIIILFNNILRRRKIEKTLKANDALFRNILINSRDILYRIDLKTKGIDYISPVIYEYTGYTAGEFMQGGLKLLKKNIHPDDRKYFIKNSKQIYNYSNAERTQLNLEYRLLCKDRKYKWFNDTMLVIHDKKGEPFYLIGNNRNVDTKKKAEEEIKSNKERMEHAFIGTGFGLWDLNLKPFEFYINDEWLNLFGYTREEIIETEDFLFSLIHPEDKMQLKKVLDKYVSGGNAFFETECRIKAKTGVYHWVFTRGKIVQRDEKDRPTRFIGMNLDITERKIMEEALKDNEMRFRMLVEKMPVLVDAYDKKGNFVFWNAECEKVTGYDKEEIIGNSKAMRFLYPDEEYRKKILNEWSKRTGIVTSWEIWITCKNGEKKLISWFNTSDLYPVSGWGTWAIGIDITEQKKSEKQLKNAKNELEKRVQERTKDLIKANRLKDEFLAYISHEFRTPMSNISLNTSYLMRQNILNGHNLEKLETIHNAVKNAVQIVDEVMDISQIESGIMRIEKKFFNINLAVDEIISAMEPQIRDKKIKVKKNISLKNIYSDPKRIKQVLTNLISNAIKYTNKGEIEITIYKEKENNVFYIKDTGIGIDEPNLEKIFAPFFRVSRSKYKAKGMGLGLTICKKIIDSLNGEIKVESHKGEGSKFIFLLPVEKN